MLQTPTEATKTIAAVRRVGHLAALAECAVIVSSHRGTCKHATNGVMVVLCQNCVLACLFSRHKPLRIGITGEKLLSFRGFSKVNIRIHMI